MENLLATKHTVALIADISISAAAGPHGCPRGRCERCRHDDSCTGETIRTAPLVPGWGHVGSVQNVGVCEQRESRTQEPAGAGSWSIVPVNVTGPVKGSPSGGLRPTLTGPPSCRATVESASRGVVTTVLRHARGRSRSPGRRLAPRCISARTGAPPSPIHLEAQRPHAAMVGTDGALTYSRLRACRSAQGDRGTPGSPTWFRPVTRLPARRRRLTACDHPGG